MSARAPDLVGALTRAARNDDALAFDDALDRVLERARDEADPEPELQALVAARLREMPSAETGRLGTAATLGAAGGLGTAARLGAAGGLGSAGGLGAAGALGAGLTRVGPATAAAARRQRYARGLGLLGAGVAIGFIWGRSPVWLPNPEVTPAGVPMVSAPIATDGSSTPTRDSSAPAHDSPAPTRDAIASPLALEDDPRARPRSSHTPGEKAGAMDSRQPSVDSPPLDASSVGAAPPVHPRAGPGPRDADSQRANPTALRSDPESLRFALQQLRKAQLFLRASEPKRALGALDLLDARVAASILRDEREVTRTLALCDAGDVKLASALAQRFLERAPDSAYATSLRESCAGPAALLEQMRERTSNPPR
jgi:hypothetical protein